MKLSKRQVVTAGAAALAAVGVMGGTLAFFTDYDSRDLTAKASRYSNSRDYRCNHRFN